LSVEFEATITSLWKLLQLPAPRFGAVPEVLLSIDAMDISLRHGGDERVLVVEHLCGQLGSEAAWGWPGMVKLLQTSLALSAVGNTVVSLDENGTDVRVRGYYPYRCRDMLILSRVIEEVNAGALTIRTLLSGPHSSRADRTLEKTKASFYDDEFIVLRP
jgi:hypothetical protein